jgi:transposase
MLTVYDYLDIRSAHAQGESIRSLARRLNHAQKTIRKAIASPTGRPQGYTRCKPQRFPKLGPFLSVIDQILKDDESAPRKQRHTSSRIYLRLRDEHGYPGQYDQVRRYVKKHRLGERETFVPLSHAPGQRAECDFGQIWVDFPDGRRPVSVLIMTWSFSHYPFMIALPTQRTEAILHGMSAALEFFACVPREVWWDNPTTVASEILKGRQRKLNTHYAALASHYRFEPLFCMPAKGQEKPDVESGVRGLQRRFATPVPRAVDLADLNRQLLVFCVSERRRIVSGQTLSIGQNFELEKQSALALPTHPFDACIQRAAVVDKYQTLQFDTNRYSVPRGQAFQTVTVKAYVDQVQIIHNGVRVASHERCYDPHASVLDPLHYLATLTRKPACLDHSNVFRGWRLPAAFAELRQMLEQQHGQRAGSRHYIRVLQLLTHHPVDRLTQSIQICRSRRTITAQIIAEKACLLAASDADMPTQDFIHPDIARRVTVPAVDLRRFDQLLSPGEPNHARTSDDATEAQPQDAAAADHAVGIQQAFA